MLLVRCEFVQVKKLVQKPQFLLCMIFITINTRKQFYLSTLKTHLTLFFPMLPFDPPEKMMLSGASKGNIGNKSVNSISRNVMLHNISLFCPIISTYVSNCYQPAAHQIVISGKEILSKEGTTQGDPTSVGTYALVLTPLLHFLHEFILINEHRSKEVTFADDLTVAGNIK